MIFRGRFEYTIDPKGRVNIPAPFRGCLEETGQGSFFLTNFSDCLYAFASDDWARIEERLSRVPSTDRKMNAFVRFFLGGADDADPSMLEIAGGQRKAFPWVLLVDADLAALDTLREAAGGRAFDGALLDL